eukprot:COSAG01_NODE_37246_length_506_cov_0.884521_1_plen_23_part_10
MLLHAACSMQSLTKAAVGHGQRC